MIGTFILLADGLVVINGINGHTTEFLTPLFFLSAAIGVLLIWAGHRLHRDDNGNSFFFSRHGAVSAVQQIRNLREEGLPEEEYERRKKRAHAEVRIQRPGPETKQPGRMMMKG